MSDRTEDVLDKEWNCEDYDPDKIKIVAWETDDGSQISAQISMIVDGGDNEESFVAHKSETILEIIDHLYDIYQAMRDKEDKA